MAEWKEAILALAEIIENPSVKKGYEELKKYYNQVGMKEASAALEFLLEKRFEDVRSKLERSKTGEV